MNTEKKIIVSSKVLANYCKECLANTHPSSDIDITIKVSENYLVIHPLSVKKMYVETLTYDYEVPITYKELRQLVNLYKAIGEQPLSITFNFFITISHILI